MKITVKELERLAYTSGRVQLAELLRQIADATPWYITRIEHTEVDVDINALLKEDAL